MKVSHNQLFTMILVLLCMSCNQKTNQSELSKQITSNYKLVELSSGIMVEEFDSIITDENKYNHNNKVFKVGNSFEYAFKHITKNGTVKYFKLDEDKIWDFVLKKDKDSKTISTITISVLNGNNMAKLM